jgi:hypothetical protein
MKNEYIEMRNRKALNMNIIYQYALSKGFNLSLSDFNFGTQWLDITILLDNLDDEYELTKLYDKNGNFIKIIN